VKSGCQLLNLQVVIHSDHAQQLCINYTYLLIYLHRQLFRSLCVLQELTFILILSKLDLLLQCFYAVDLTTGMEGHLQGIVSTMPNSLFPVNLAQFGGICFCHIFGHCGLLGY